MRGRGKQNLSSGLQCGYFKSMPASTHATMPPQGGTSSGDVLGLGQLAGDAVTVLLKVLEVLRSLVNLLVLLVRQVLQALHICNHFILSSTNMIMTKCSRLQQSINNLIHFSLHRHIGP